MFSYFKSECIAWALVRWPKLCREAWCFMPYGSWCNSCRFGTWVKNQSFIADQMLFDNLNKINSSNETLSNKGCDEWLSNGDLKGTCQMILFNLSHLFSRIRICHVGYVLHFHPCNCGLVIQLCTRASIQQGRTTPVKSRKHICHWSQMITMYSSKGVKCLLLARVPISSLAVRGNIYLAFLRASAQRQTHIDILDAHNPNSNIKIALEMYLSMVDRSWSYLGRCF